MSEVSGKVFSGKDCQVPHGPSKLAGGWGLRPSLHTSGERPLRGDDLAFKMCFLPVQTKHCSS